MESPGAVEFIRKTYDNPLLIQTEMRFGCIYNQELVMTIALNLSRGICSRQSIREGL